MKTIMKIFLVIVIIAILNSVTYSIACAESNPCLKWQDTEDTNGDGVPDGDGIYEITCTWFCWQQVYDTLGIALPDNFARANAKDWIEAASGLYSVGDTPLVNSIAVWTNGYYGHVAFVTSVDGDNFLVNEGGRADLDHTESQGVAYNVFKRNASYIKFIYVNLGSFVTYVDDIRGLGGGIYLKGWTYNQGNVTKSTQVHVYLDGPAGSSAQSWAVLADQARVDVDEALHVGAFHGFEQIIPGISPGQHTVYLYANDQYLNQSAEIGKYTITVPSDTVAPTISNVVVSNITSAGYTVSCDVSDNVGIEKIQFPTWTTSNDQDDLIWHDATISNGKASYYVKTTDHKHECGTYVTHIYAWDYAGNRAAAGDELYPSLIVKVPNPIRNVQVSDVTSKGYTVTCEVDSAWGASKVEFPTWTEQNGQDDLAHPWQEGTISGNTATFHVDVKDHNNETGCNYITHIYAFDASGNQTSVNNVDFPCLLISVPRAEIGSGTPYTGSTGETHIGAVTIINYTGDIYIKETGPLIFRIEGGVIPESISVVSYDQASSGDEAVYQSGYMLYDSGDFPVQYDYSITDTPYGTAIDPEDPALDVSAPYFITFSPTSLANTPTGKWAFVFWFRDTTDDDVRRFYLVQYVTFVPQIGIELLAQQDEFGSFFYSSSEQEPLEVYITADLDCLRIMNSEGVVFALYDYSADPAHVYVWAADKTTHKYNYSEMLEFGDYFAEDVAGNKYIAGKSIKLLPGLMTQLDYGDYHIIVDQSNHNSAGTDKYLNQMTSSFLLCVQPGINAADGAEDYIKGSNNGIKFCSSWPIDYDDDGTLAFWIDGQKINGEYYSISDDHQNLWIYSSFLDQLTGGRSYTLTARLWRLNRVDGSKETFYPANTSFNILDARNYYINLDANGGYFDDSPADDMIRASLSEDLRLPWITPTREGWYFAGWAETADAGKATYYPNDYFSKDEDTTLFALWVQPDLVLPAALRVIEDEAFAGGSFSFVKLPDMTCFIGRHAFADCRNLGYIYISEETTEIDEQAFGNKTELTVIGYRGSVAENYAATHGFTFIPA